MTKPLEQSSPENTGVQTTSGLRYRPIIELGHGGMANVLLSVGRGPSGFNKLVVLKTMRRELVTDPDMREMFLAEARLSARLNHPNVVQVYEVVDTALPCIIMEYLEGQPMSYLHRAMRENFTLPMQLKIITEVLSGLHYSHELSDYDGTPLNIVHRDVSPQNVFITYDGVVKVLDFGIAKTNEATSHTQAGLIKGKVSYMPREQLLGEPVDRRADVYAVGCMLWHAAAGVKLWHDVPEGEIMHALIDGRIPKPSSKRRVEPHLEAIIMRALAPLAEQRYPTALDLRHDLDRYLAEKSPGTSLRDISELMLSAFVEQREARKRQIHQSLSAAPSEPPPPIPEGIEPLVRSGTGESSNPILSAPNKRNVLWMALTAALAIGCSFAYFAMRGAGSPPAASAKPAVAAPIQLRITAEPAAAALFIDGRPLEGNPATLTAVRDSLEHEIRATATGYQDHKKSVRFDRDLSLDLMLQPVAAPPAPSVAADAVNANPKLNVPPAANNSRPAATPKKAKSSCDPPFYYENGIKTYKPGCL